MYYIYGSKGCRYCTLAEEILQRNGIAYEYYDIKSPNQKDKLQFIRDQGFTTIPQIYRDDEYIGTYNALHTYLEAKLDATSK